jgi:LysM domain
MQSVADIADWWDQQHRESKEALDAYVENNPGHFSVIVATSTYTAMELGAGMVDILRFGQGVAEGGWKGYGKDAIRLVGLMGPLGRGAKIAQTSANAGLARLVVDPGGPMCAWVSATQALRQTGTKAFAAVDDLAKALGTSVGNFGGASLDTLVTAMQQIGARMGAIKSVSSLDDIAKMTQNNGAVTIFTVFGKRMEGGVLKSVGHAVYAYRDALGRLKILDRGGNAGNLPEVFIALEGLAMKYTLQGQWAVRQAVVMENVFAKFAGHVGSAPVLALPVLALTGANKLESETVAQAFEVSKTARLGATALEKRGARSHVVAQGEMLSAISQRFFGDAGKWPVIFEANRGIIGSNPDLIRRGQRLLVPLLPRVNGIN